MTQIQPLLTQPSAKVHGNYNHATPALQSTRLIGFITHISLGPPKFNGCLTCYCFFFSTAKKKSKFVLFSARDGNQINMQMININQSTLSPGAPDSQAPLFTELLLNDIANKSAPIVSLYELLRWEKNETDSERWCILRFCSMQATKHPPDFNDSCVFRSASFVGSILRCCLEKQTALFAYH